MKKYSHLTEYERYQISALHKSGHNNAFIAKHLARNPSTISRELAINKGFRGYRPKQAHSLAQARKSTQNARRLTPFYWAYVEHLLQEYWSPEQIHGNLKVRGFAGGASIEHIYRYIYLNKSKGGDLHKYLRCKKKYRKRGYANHDRRGKLAGRRGIEFRPTEADQRLEIGHFEADLVMGKGHSGAIVTVVDRKTRLSKITYVKSKSSSEVHHALINVFKGLPVKTITFDNGKEFSQHIELDRKLSCTSYFANPYCSWERGSNENFNGLLRQFLPKYQRLDKVTLEELQKIEDRLNLRPRKILNYLSPIEVVSRNYTIALRC